MSASSNFYCAMYQTCAAGIVEKSGFLAIPLAGVRLDGHYGPAPAAAGTSANSAMGQVIAGISLDSAVARCLNLA